ncbi:efflux RND transporter periplasmic adaptor subunit [Cribrihabitans sp. XS_ASV171]
MSRFPKIIAGLLVVAAFVAGGIFGTDVLLSKDEDEGNGSGQGQRPVRVAITMPEARRIENAVSAVGTLKPEREVEIVPNVPGRVTEVPVVSGQDVEKGALLVQLDDRAARAALANAEATLNEARQEYRRFEELEERNAAAEAQLEEVRAALLRAEAAVMTSQANLEDRAITAPFGGRLGVIDTVPGSYLDTSEPVTRLSDLSSVEVSLSLPERYFDRILPDQEVTVETPAYPEERFTGHVALRAPWIDLGTRSFEVRATIENEDRRLVGGMFANSRIVIDAYDGLAVPDDAIISEGLGTYVFTIADGKAARTEIEPGVSIGSMTEVRSGLTEGNRVVVAGWDQLSDGAAVEIAETYAEEGLK